MKRYAPGTIDAPRGSVVARMFEDPRGEWVRFDDVALLEKQEALANHHNASCSMLAQRCNVLEKERDALKAKVSQAVKFCDEELTGDFSGSGHTSDLPRDVLLKTILGLLK